LSKLLLVVSNKDDITTDLVVRRLKQRGELFYRFNTEEFTSSITGAIEIADKGGFTVLLSSIKQTLNLEDIFSIWYRRPVNPNIATVNMHKDDAQFALRESNAFLMNLWSVMEEKTWVNHPFALYKAERKLFQLINAKKVGFLIPDTLVSNDIEQIKLFLSKNKHGSIIKPISHGLIGNDDKCVIYTTEFDIIKHPLLMEEIKSSPFMLQAKIQKEFDVRVSVFGNAMFAHKIIIKSKKRHNVDWRTYLPHELEYETFKLPKGCSERINVFMENMGLKYGAFDFIYTKDKRLCFIEVNPSGQFAWLELSTKDKMIDALIDLLRGEENGL